MFENAPSTKKKAAKPHVKKYGLERMINQKKGKGMREQRDKKKLKAKQSALQASELSAKQKRNDVSGFMDEPVKSSKRSREDDEDESAPSAGGLTGFAALFAAKTSKPTDEGKRSSKGKGNQKEDPDKPLSNKALKRQRQVEDRFSAPVRSELAQSDKKKPKKKLTALQAKMQQRLEGAQFRMINEHLYTTRGDEMFDKFKKDPALFKTYHEGFREMARKWPDNPLDAIIFWVSAPIC